MYTWIAYVITSHTLVSLLWMPLDELFKALYELKTLILRIYTD
jgi:hypothetical protein